jgi:hypothetical protein
MKVRGNGLHVFGAALKLRGYRPGAAVAIGALIGGLVLGPSVIAQSANPAPAVMSEPLIRLSTDPYSIAQCERAEPVGPQSNCQPRSEVEPDTLSFGETIVSTFQVGRIPNGGAANIGFATSGDGGATWKNGFLPGLTKLSNPPGPYDRASDASVAFDAKHHVWLIESLGIKTPDLSNEGADLVDVVVNRSTDGGLQWGNALVVNPNPGTLFLDKSWIVCDTTPTSPFYGNCYAEFDDAAHNDTVFMSTSGDGGLTWGPPQTTSDPADAFSTPPFGTGTAGGHGLGGQPLVQPDGRVVVPYVNLDVELGFPNPSGNNGFFAFAIGAFNSGDGGATWSQTFIVSEADFRQPNPSCGLNLEGCGIRADIPLPSGEIDRSGKVFVTWSDCRFEPACSASDIVMSTSTDGIGWTAVQRIPIHHVGSSADHFLPGIGVDRSTQGDGAHLGLVYYYYPDANCNLDTCNLFAGFVSSTNGGRTWSTNEQIAGPMKLNWLPDTTQGFMTGDYFSTSIAQGANNAHPVIAVAKAPNGGVLDDAMFTPAHEALSISGGSTATDGGSGGAAVAVPMIHINGATGQSSEPLPGQPTHLAHRHTRF